MAPTIRYPTGHSSNDWALILSSAVNEGAPDGDVVYLFANKVFINRRSQDKTTRSSNRKSRRLARGQVEINITAPRIWIPTRSVAELNTLNSYLSDWKDKDHAPIYIWIRAKYSGSWVWVDFPAVDGSMVDYLMGYLDYDNDELGQMFLKSLKFSNAYTGGA